MNPSSDNNSTSPGPVPMPSFVPTISQPAADAGITTEDVLNGGTADVSSHDDSDLIEKVWVIKAKQILLNSKSDPYAQNQQMNALRADFMQKRYHKIIKLG